MYMEQIFKQIHQFYLTFFLLFIFETKIVRINK